MLGAKEVGDQLDQGRASSHFASVMLLPLNMAVPDADQLHKERTTWERSVEEMEITRWSGREEVPQGIGQAPVA
jgi:hypothetical protein